MSARPETFLAGVKRDFAVSAAPAAQLALVAVLPFLPFLFLTHGGGVGLATRSAYFIAAGCVLVALLLRWLYLAFAIVFVPLSVLSIHLILRFGAGKHGWQLNQPDSRVETYFESPDSEIGEYFSSHWWPSDTLMLALGVAYLLLLAWVFYTRPALARAARVAVLVALAGWAAIAAAVGIGGYLDQWPQYQLVQAAWEARSRVEKLAERGDAIAHQVLPSQDCTGRYKKVVIVFGESASIAHMSAFGYGRKTTPFAERSRPYLFEALAPSNQTRVSLVLMTTPADAEDFDEFYETPSLVSRLAACGYRTLWISNQGRVGRHDSLASSLAREADQEVFLNELSYKEVEYDGAIVDELERLGAFRATKQATFIHLIGSHTDYEKRYPKGFGFPDPRGAVDHYDNSILYTDSILAELYERFGQDGVLFVYVPDHGEVVTEKVFGHGFSPGYREEYQVPLMIWTRDEKSIESIRHVLGGRPINLESFENVVNYLVGGLGSLRVSTRTLVSNLSASNLVHFEAMPSFGGSKPDERQEKIRPPPSPGN